MRFATDEDFYRWVDARIDSSVDRDLPEVSTEVGEFESAVFDLLEYASTVGRIPEEVIAVMRDEYPDGPYRDYFGDIVRINDRKRDRNRKLSPSSHRIPGAGE